MIIDKTDIERWGQHFDSKGNFPRLVGKLIFESTRRDTILHFATGSEIFMGGWDGTVTCQEATGYVPKGVSLWEIGTNGDIAKANRDYAKRVKNSLGFEKGDCTFIFVTTSMLQGKDQWVKERKADGVWKDVIVYDSRNITAWLEKCPVSMLWFSTVVKDYPYDSIYIAEEAWKMFSMGPPGVVIVPRLVTAGREAERKILEVFLTGTNGLRGVRASTKDEAVAFIIATALQFEQRQQEQFMSRTLVVDSLKNFHATRINKSDLNIIAKLEDSTTAYSAAPDHHVLLPLGPDDEFNSQDVLTLPRIDRDGQIESLKLMGLNSEDAERKSRECGRDLTILKTLLGFPPPRRNQIRKETIVHFLPALLIGRWNESNQGDRSIIERLANEYYDKYTDRLHEWLKVELPPLIKIGETWRLASPWDAWTAFSHHLSKENFEKLKIVYLEVLGEIDPALSLSGEKRYMASVYGKTSAYSSWLKEGLNQALILIAVNGQKLHLRYLESPQGWVDDVIQSLLKGAPGELWASLNQYMPLLAEAAPDKFMDAVKYSLFSDEKHILKMFEEEESVIAPGSRHTGLLWALEGLAWDERYFHQAVLLLAKLAEVDPGGTLANRPLSSLVEIFMPWHYQTFAPMEQRIKTLEAMLAQDKEVAWKLALSLLPSHRGMAQNTHRMRWRFFDKSFAINYAWEEVFATHTGILDLLLRYTDFSEEKLSALISASDNFLPGDRDRLLRFVTENVDSIRGNNNLLWHALRNMVTHHSEFPSAGWALDKNQLNKYRAILERFEPKDLTSKLAWLFNEQWPVPLEGAAEFHQSTYENQQQSIDENRVNKLNDAYEQLGLNNLLALIPSIKEHWAFGAALAHVVDHQSEISTVISLLKGDEKEQVTVQGFFQAKRDLKGMDWVVNAFESSVALGLDPVQRAKILLTFPQKRIHWNYIASLEPEVQRAYWKEMSPWFWKLEPSDRLYGLNRLIEAKRVSAALNVSYHNLKGLPSRFLVDLLTKIAADGIEEGARLERHPVEKVLKELESRNNVDRSDMIRLEWLYMPLLTSVYSNRKPLLLHDELSLSPEFFVNVLKWTYRPEDDREEQEEISDAARENRARAGFELLHSWKKIPGVDEQGKIDSAVLRNWISAVRDLARSQGRLRVADAHIGQVLAQYPETEGVQTWPPVEIASIIDELNLDSLNNNFYAATINKRGSTTRGVFDGGAIEREYAAYFHGLSAKFIASHPVTSKILSDIAENFLKRAKREDEMAEREKLDT